MPTRVILIVFRVYTHTNNGLQTHVIGTLCFKFQALSILMILHYGHRLLPPRSAQGFVDNKGYCLNCHGTDHSFRRCPRPLINDSGYLNPHLGQLGNNGEAYRRLQQRMRSHKRRDTRSSSSSDRRMNSPRRNDNNYNRYNHGVNLHEPWRNNSRNNGQGS